MRTATDKTKKSLRRAIGDGKYSTWARANGVKPTAVHAVLNDRPISTTRENGVRAALGLPLLPERKGVAILTVGQRVVTEHGGRKYITRQIRLSHDEAAVLDDFLERAGYRSFSEYWHKELSQMVITR